MTQTIVSVLTSHFLALSPPPLSLSDSFLLLFPIHPPITQYGSLYCSWPLLRPVNRSFNSFTSQCSVIIRSTSSEDIRLCRLPSCLVFVALPLILQKTPLLKHLVTHRIDTTTKQPDGIPYRVDTDNGPRGTQQGYNVSYRRTLHPPLRWCR